MGWKFKWTGLKENVEGLRNLPTVLSEEVKQTENEEAIKIFDRSQELVPRKTGALAASGRVEDNKVIYDIDYASEVHEDVAAFHDDGQSKFVEVPFNEAKPEIEKSLSESVDRAFNKIVK